MLIEKIIEFELRGPRPPVIHVLQQLIIFMIYKNLNRKSSCKLLFTAKILHEANDNVPCLPYLGQISYKI